MNNKMDNKMNNKMDTNEIISQAVKNINVSSIKMVASMESAISEFKIIMKNICNICESIANNLELNKNIDSMDINSDRIPPEGICVYRQIGDDILIEKKSDTERE